MTIDSTIASIYGVEKIINKNAANGYIGADNSGKVSLSSLNPITNNEIDNAAAISWSKISKTNSNITDITTRSHTSLSDIGTNTHSAIDTHLAAPHAVMTSGTYAGNSSENRSVAHGLGIKPKIVMIYRDGAADDFILDTFVGYVRYILGTGAVWSVTVADSTYFYVGNATNYGQSANHSCCSYRWVASV